MEKVYRLLPWISLEQALTYLEYLTDTQVTKLMFLQLCEEDLCHVYVNVHGVRGFNRDSYEDVCARGIHMATNPVDAFSEEDVRTSCTVCTVGEDDSGNTIPWRILMGNPDPIFKPLEIEALAAKINGNDSDIETSQPEQTTVSLSQQPISEKRLLLTIAGLLELLTDRTRPSYNQGSAAKAIADKGWHGVGERQINGVFSAAKKAAQEASK